MIFLFLYHRLCHHQLQLFWMILFFVLMISLYHLSVDLFRLIDRNQFLNFHLHYLVLFLCLVEKVLLNQQSVDHSDR